MIFFQIGPSVIRAAEFFTVFMAVSLRVLMDTVGRWRSLQTNAGADMSRNYFTTNTRGLKQAGERFWKISGIKRKISSGYA